MMWESWTSYSGKHKIIRFYGQIKINPGELRKDSGDKGVSVGGPSPFGGPMTDFLLVPLGETAFAPSAGASPSLLLIEFLDMKPVPFTINN